MTRFLFLAAAGLALTASPAAAKRIALPPPANRAATADVVVVGTVTAVEKETVDAKPYPVADKPQAYTVAVIKVQDGLIGAAGLTHVKVGFVALGAPAPGRGPGRGGWGVAPLAEGQSGLFFLTKHPTAGFYTVGPMAPPVDAADPDYKAQVAAAKAVAAAVADPMKALTAEKAGDRAAAAAALVARYRHGPQDAEAVEVPVGAEESKLLLAGLAGVDWAAFDGPGVQPAQAFYQIGLGDADGWKQPAVAKPGENYNVALRAAFAKWVGGPGKDYRVKKRVAKSE